MERTMNKLTAADVESSPRLARPTHKGADMSKPWLEIVHEARARGYFTEEERKLANQWPACSCGELDEGIPRGRGGAGRPLDLELYRLGFGFAYAVHNNDFDRAEELMAAITARAAIVLAEMAYVLAEMAYARRKK